MLDSDRCISFIAQPNLNFNPAAFAGDGNITIDIARGGPLYRVKSRDQNHSVNLVIIGAVQRIAEQGKSCCLVPAIVRFRLFPRSCHKEESAPVALSARSAFVSILLCLNIVHYPQLTASSLKNDHYRARCVRQHPAQQALLGKGFTPP